MPEPHPELARANPVNPSKVNWSESTSIHREEIHPRSVSNLYTIAPRTTLPWWGKELPKLTKNQHNQSSVINLWQTSHIPCNGVLSSLQFLIFNRNVCTTLYTNMTGFCRRIFLHKKQCNDAREPTSSGSGRGLVPGINSKSIHRRIN